MGTRCIADLRMLGEKLAQLYGGPLAAKNEQIMELRQHVEAAERQRDALEAQIREIKRSGVKYLTTLRSLSEQLSRRIKDTDGLPEAVEPRDQ
jgi:chromosome segregation ATPase